MGNERTAFLQRQRDRQSGAALILLVLALTLLALAVVGGMRFWGPKDDLRRATQNGTSNRIETAIDRYVIANGQLPCPDVSGAGQSTASSCNVSTPTWGLVPWQTLGLSPQDAVDAWGRRFTYALATNSNSGTTPNVCNTTTSTSNSGGGLASWNNLTPVSGSASIYLAYLIVNHGPNGRGAFQQNGAQVGSQLAASPGSDEAYNCPRNVNVAGQACPPSPTGTTGQTYWPGPYRPQSAGTTAWFDDIVIPQTSQPYACLCVQPTITTSINATTGTVTATASLTSPATCDTTWTTSVGQGSGWGTAAWLPANCAGYPITTIAGNSCSVTSTLTPPGIVAASNLGSAGWLASAVPGSPAYSFLTSPTSTGSPTPGATATAMPAMSGMGFATGTGGMITSCSQCSNTISNTSGTTSLSYVDMTGTITIAANSGTLCYETNTETLGVIQSGGGCYLDGTAGDTLTITLSNATFRVYSMVLDFENSGATAQVTEMNGATTYDPGYSNVNPVSYSEATTGFLIIPWQRVIETLTSDGTTTQDFYFNKLVLAPSSSSQIGLSQFIISP